MKGVCADLNLYHCCNVQIRMIRMTFVSITLNPAIHYTHRLVLAVTAIWYAEWEVSSDHNLSARINFVKLKTHDCHPQSLRMQGQATTTTQISITEIKRNRIKYSWVFILISNARWSRRRKFSQQNIEKLGFAKGKVSCQSKVGHLASQTKTEQNVVCFTAQNTTFRFGNKFSPLIRNWIYAFLVRMPFAPFKLVWHINVTSSK